MLSISIDIKTNFICVPRIQVNLRTEACTCTLSAAEVQTVIIEHDKYMNLKVPHVEGWKTGTQEVRMDAPR